MSGRLLVAEVVQSSAMDCGPAALKAIADGFGIELSYGRLREACHTEVDGTSIDTIEELALEIGLDAEQVLIPVDHVLLDGLNLGYVHGSQSQVLKSVITPIATMRT